MPDTSPIIYLAPLQGCTDHVFRNAYHKHFNWIDKYFIPYISIEGNGEIRNSRKKEAQPENNKTTNAIPQILVKDIEETRQLCIYIKELGYQEINLNLGCPHAMVTKKGRGAGLLPHPKKVKEIIDCIFQEFNFRLSIKSRTGLINHTEFEEIAPVLQQYPINEIILHPRTGKQMYKGEADIQQFLKYQKESNLSLIYNGDITEINYKKILQKLEPDTSIMIGRGIASDIFLPAKIKSFDYTPANWKEFHQSIYLGYCNDQDNEGNILNKLKQFWLYFGNMFPNEKKILKAIKKSRHLNDYTAAVSTIK